MTNIQGLYFCVAITIIAAFIICYVVVKRNADGKFDKSANQTAVKRPFLTVMLYPLFILLGLSIIVFVLFFHSF